MKCMICVLLQGTSDAKLLCYNDVNCDISGSCTGPILLGHKSACKTDKGCILSECLFIGKQSTWVNLTDWETLNIYCIHWRWWRRLLQVDFSSIEHDGRL